MPIFWVPLSSISVLATVPCTDGTRHCVSSSQAFGHVRFTFVPQDQYSDFCSIHKEYKSLKSRVIELLTMNPKQQLLMTTRFFPVKSQFILIPVNFSSNLSSCSSLWSQCWGESLKAEEAEEGPNKWLPGCNYGHRVKIPHRQNHILVNPASPDFNVISYLDESQCPSRYKQSPHFCRKHVGMWLFEERWPSKALSHLICHMLGENCHFPCWRLTLVKLYF